MSRFDQITCPPNAHNCYEVNAMRVFWEQTGVLLPIYRLAGQGLSDGEIAKKLGIAESRVQSCVAWVLHFLRIVDRDQLVQYASPVALPLVL